MSVELGWAIGAADHWVLEMAARDTSQPRALEMTAPVYCEWFDFLGWGCAVLADRRVPHFRFSPSFAS